MNDIRWAAQHLQSGNRVARMGWYGQKWLVLSYPAGSAEPDVYVRTDVGDRPWICSPDDLLATDWTVVLAGS